MLRRLALIVGTLFTLAAAAGSYDDILIAAEKGDTTQVIDLLRRGLDVNTADASGNTLLMIAARNGNIELLDFLLKNRSNTLKKNRYGDSAIMLATFRGHLPIVQRLLDAGVDIDGAGWNPVHYAAFSGRADILRLLVNHHADLDAPAPNGQTALMLAAGAGRLEAVKILVEADADVEAEQDDGTTALKLAEKAGHKDVADYLRAVTAED